MVKKALVVKRLKKAGEGTFCDPQEVTRAEGVSTSIVVLSPTAVLGPIRLPSPTLLEHGQGSTSTQPFELSQAPSLSPPPRARHVTISFKDGS